MREKRERVRKKPVWDFLGSLGGCWLKKVQAFLKGVAMVFFHDAIVVELLGWSKVFSALYSSGVNVEEYYRIRNCERKKERSKIREMRV